MATLSFALTALASALALISLGGGLYEYSVWSIPPGRAVPS